jgi:ATP-binding cassette subfamily B protein
LKEVLTQNQDILLTSNSEFYTEKDDFKKARQKGAIHWILKHIIYKKNKFLVTSFILLNTSASLLNSFLMILIGLAIDAFALGGIDQLFNFTFLTVIIGMGTPFIGLSARLCREVVAQRIERDARKEFYFNLIGKSQSFHDNQRLGDIMARATNDVRFLNFLISPALGMLIDASINLVVPIVLIAYNFPLQLVIVPVVFSVIFLLYLRRFLRKLTPATINRRIAFGDMNAVLNESLAGIEIVKSMAQEEQSVEKYKDSAISYRDWGIKQGDIMAKYLPILFLSFSITIGLTHSIFLNRIGVISIGDVIGFIGLLLRLRFPVNASIWSFQMVKQATVGANRLLETMNEHSEIKEKKSPITRYINGSVSFKNVTFSYPGTQNKVLKNINFEVSEGQTVAIVGTTGSGKTSLTKLISRLYDVKEGEILIDRIDVRNYSLQSLRDQIAYIEQDIFIFSDSIFDNIAFGREFSEEQIIHVAQDAQALSFIEKLPSKFYTEVGERGVQLSGGERQRIAIARAFLSDPKILILDDSSSAIDSETEEKIQHAIFKILRGRTTFIITHRLSQIRSADHIIVLNRGEIVDQGTHENLLKNSEEYRKIFIKRFDKTIDELLGGK